LAIPKNPDSTVTAADISRNFGEWQNKAMSAPITITHHGRARLVLSSVDHYQARGENGTSIRADAWQANAKIHAVLSQMQDGFLAFDARLRITDANAAAELFVGVAKDQLIGRDLREILPRTQNSIAWDHFGRVLRNGQPVEFQIRSVLHDGVRLKVKAFPFDDKGMAVIFTNLGAQEEATELVRRLNAMQAAVRAEAGLALIRINPRGGIDAVDPAFQDMTGFSETQLLDLLMIDIIHVHHRYSFTRALNAVVREGSVKTVVATILARDGEERSFRFHLGVAENETIPEEIMVCVASLNERSGP
jgi:PAS domain S-box-containing protein